ncbi:MAG: hypothetical protein WC356_00580 [Candidatus Micrarchaeia archaeon]|jgi:hypothetical protein
MVGGMFKLFLAIIAIVFVTSFALFFGVLDLDNLNPSNLLNTMGNMISRPDPDIKGNIVSGSLKARSIEGDINGGKGIEAEEIIGNINGGEDITAEELYGDITNGSNINLDAMVGDIKGGKDIKVDTLVGDVSGGENVKIKVLIGEDKTKDSAKNKDQIINNTNTITIDRIIEKETVIKEIC